MRTPVPQQSSFSSMEEGSRWSAQETRGIAKLEQYVNNSDCIKLEIDEVEARSTRTSDVKHVLRNATRESRKIRSCQCERKRRASSRKQVAMG